MTNITIAIDEEIHRLARIRAAELNTSVSALVGEYLRSLAGLDHAEEGVVVQADETERERGNRKLLQVIEKIRRRHPDFKVADNLPREELYDRARARAEAEAKHKQQNRKLRKVIERITANGGGLRMGEDLSREELYDEVVARAEHQAASSADDKSPE